MSGKLLQSTCQMLYTTRGLHLQFDRFNKLIEVQHDLPAFTECLSTNHVLTSDKDRVKQGQETYCGAM